MFAHDQKLELSNSPRIRFKNSGVVKFEDVVPSRKWGFATRADTKTTANIMVVSNLDQTNKTVLCKCQSASYPHLKPLGQSFRLECNSRRRSRNQSADINLICSRKV